MSFLDQVLKHPSYGYMRDGELYVPSHRELFKEFLNNINVFADRKNWLSFFGWATSVSFGIPLMIFFFYYFSWPLAFLGFIYSMVVLGSHGTIWLHRYSAHRGYRFSNSFARFVCRNLVIKIVPEETYAISHHLHHYLSEKPGDPYNVFGGWLYCFLADANHQNIRRDLNEKEYARLSKLIEHTGIKFNTYEQYQKWGTLSNPARTIIHCAMNWLFWYGAFYLIGGHALALVLFGSSGIWAIGIRTFNFDGHGGGKDKRKDGIDFCRTDLSINHSWVGYVAGEWHNNHHLYPNGARSGFLPYQLDLPWLFIRFYSLVGGIESYRDYKDEFLADHYLPYLKKKNLALVEET